MTESIPTRQFRAVVGKLLEGRLVPLAGAGISFGAEKPSSWLSVKYHSTERMGASLRAEITKSVHCGSYAATRLSGTHDTDLGRLCELFFATRSRGHFRARYTDLVDSLKIRDFALLQPTLAHRAIAWLAREGMIGEVLTTNYDACFERAWLDGHGRTGEHAVLGSRAGRPNPSEAECAKVELETGLSRVHDLSSYQSRGWTRQSRALTAPSTRFRVAKLNGCAVELTRQAAHLSEPAGSPRTIPYAASILLTETQLQDWRHRKWAQDLFRDRLRRSSVILTGFGSDEPQVRLTLTAVQEEFGAMNSDADERGPHDSDGPTEELACDRPNAFLTCLFARSDFTSTVLQSVLAYRDNQAPACNWEDLVLGPEIRQAFAFQDTRGSTLPADDFWLELHGWGVAAVLERALRPGGCHFTSSVRGLAVGSALLVELQRWLGVDRLAVWLDVGEATQPRPADGPLAEMMVVEPGSLRPRFAAVLDAMVWPGSRDDDTVQSHGWRARYQAIADNVDDILWLLLAVWALDSPFPTGPVKLGELPTLNPGANVRCEAGTCFSVRRFEFDRRAGPDGPCLGGLWLGRPSIPREVRFARLLRDNDAPNDRGSGSKGTIDLGFDEVAVEEIVARHGESWRDVASAKLDLQHRLLAPLHDKRLSQPSIHRDLERK